MSAVRSHPYKRSSHASRHTIRAPSATPAQDPHTRPQDTHRTRSESPVYGRCGSAPALVPLCGSAPSAAYPACPARHDRAQDASPLRGDVERLPDGPRAVSGDQLQNDDLAPEFGGDEM